MVQLKLLEEILQFLFTNIMNFNLNQIIHVKSTAIDIQKPT